MSDILIKAESLTKTYTSKQGRIHAVDRVSLHVKAGEIYGFLGPNGAGKSTTVAMLVTLLRPTSGKAWIGPWEISAQPSKVRQLIGAALQSVSVDTTLTGREHLHFQAMLYGIARDERRRQADELLARVGLEDAADRVIGRYSGGMKRRLDLALALLHRPRVLFLDEPTTGLDPQSRHALWTEVSRLAREEGVAVFLTTQYLEEADKLADRVAIIKDGRIIAEDTPNRLKAQIGNHTLTIIPAQPDDIALMRNALGRIGSVGVAEGRVLVQLPNGTSDIPHIVRLLDDHRITLDSLHLSTPTLDDVFLALTGALPEGAHDAVEGVLER